MLSNKMPTSFVPTEYTEPKMDVPTTNPEPRITPHTPRKVEKNVPPLFFEKARGGGGNKARPIWCMSTEFKCLASMQTGL